MMKRIGYGCGPPNFHTTKNPFSRRYATQILSKLWEKDKKRSEKILTNLADDEHWLVREYAHGVWGELLKKHFQQVFPILQEWSKHSSASLRRCVAIAARSAGNLRKEEWAERLVSLLEPLLSDKTAYVRKNLGPYAIGDGLLRCYLEPTLKHLRKWVHRKNEGTRWNVAMAFASYGGNKNWREGIEILAILATDERRYVWRAVASSLLYLARRHPEIQDMLKAWLKDSKRSKVAETVLEYLIKKVQKRLSITWSLFAHSVSANLEQRECSKHLHICCSTPHLFSAELQAYLAKLQPIGPKQAVLPACTYLVSSLSESHHTVPSVP